MFFFRTNELLTNLKLFSEIEMEVFGIVKTRRQFWQRSLTVGRSKLFHQLVLCFMVKRKFFENTLQRQGPFLSKIIAKGILLKLWNKKNEVEGNLKY